MAVTWSCAFAQPAKQYEPKEYQDGKDVVWVPTAQTLVDRMLDIANVTASDTVIDLGSGDGRTVITAAKRGAKALGVEYNPKMVALSKANAAKEGVTDKATFVKADLFKTDFSQATVITMFLLPEINLKLRPRILGMKPGTRVVSNSFDMGDWKADKTIDPVEQVRDLLQRLPLDRAREGWGNLGLSPGQARAQAEFPVPYRHADVRQGRRACQRAPQRADITFTAGGTQYTGRVDGNVIEGTSKTGDKEEPWKATRGKTKAKRIGRHASLDGSLRDWRRTRRRISPATIRRARNLVDTCKEQWYPEAREPWRDLWAARSPQRSPHCLGNLHCRWPCC